MIRVFIGFDYRETLAFNVLSHSIHSNASGPVSITPVITEKLKDYNRPYKQQTNLFTYSRFLVPHLCNYEGVAIFMDCDMLCLGDVYELAGLHEDQYAVSVVKHKYTPSTDRKALGVQIAYPKKNWSSVMVMSCDKCRNLTPDFVNTAHPSELHQFKWLSTGDDIGELPKEWNHLVSEYPENPDAKLIHFTLGGPYFSKYQRVEFADEWRFYFMDMLKSLEGEEITA